MRGLTVPSRTEDDRDLLCKSGVVLEVQTASFQSCLQRCLPASAPTHGEEFSINSVVSVSGRSRGVWWSLP